jgi:hypothetical protein
MHMKSIVQTHSLRLLKTGLKCTTPCPPFTAPLLSVPPYMRQHAREAACKAYAQPEVYDIAFSFRDFDEETAFLLSVFQRHNTVKDVGGLTFLEIGQVCMFLDAVSHHGAANSSSQVEYLLPILEIKQVHDITVGAAPPRTAGTC